MLALAFLETAYTFRHFSRVFNNIHPPDTNDQALLAHIEEKLVEAHNLYLNRRYQDAIDSYQETESLIFSHIDPAYPGTHDGVQLPRDMRLFTPLLSASLEWLNVLPVHQPISEIRPRVPVDSQLLSTTKTLDQAGISSSQLSSSPQVLNALADWQQAQIYTRQGNTSAAAFFGKRAQDNAPELVRQLGEIASGGRRPGTQPVGAPVARGGGTIHFSGPSLSAVLERSLLTAGLQLRTPIALPSSMIENRTFGTLLDGNIVKVDWKAGETPPIEDINNRLYASRTTLSKLSEIAWKPHLPSDLAVQLPHYYYYVIPLAIGECYHALGNYDLAEQNYMQAASYQYLNQNVEAPYVWMRLSTLYLDWGNTLYREEQVADALSIYQNVLMTDGSIPNSKLYTTASIKSGADIARTVISNLDKVTTLKVNPTIAANIVDIHQQLIKIQSGLDFWGFWLRTVPIWTFEYLQNVAINFAQLAISAERDVINFWDRADQGSLIRQQIAQNVQQTQAEVTAAQLQANAAYLEVKAYLDGFTLALQRAADARANASDYAKLSKAWIMHQALSSQLSGGDNGDAAELTRYSDRMMSGNYSLSGDRATLAAAEQLTGARLNRDFEVNSLIRQATEMDTAARQANDELQAANARASAARAAVNVAQLRASAAHQNLVAFDNQFFTPDVWHRMGDTMWQIYQRYLTMAIRAARMMQQAYNFEMDQSLSIIKGDYSSSEVKGLLGADTLMADIQSFTYNLITTDQDKPQPVRQTISLAQRYPFAFENQLRKTGVMNFTTRIQDFDIHYPGTYAGRIEAIEIEVDGIIPPNGVSGTITNSGISSYRTPSSVQLDPNNHGLKFRIQPRETLVLSDYAARQDALLIENDQRMLRIFQGAGLASTWSLELPKEINDIDYGALTDVRMTFYYKARFDPNLRDRVIAELRALPNNQSAQRGIPLRWIYPDAFFHFQDTGELNFRLRASDFQRNETKPELNYVSLLVVTDGSVAPTSLNISLSTPTHASVSGQTNAEGIIASDTGMPWVRLASGTAIGDYTISLKAPDNPGLVKNGQLVLTPIVNTALILGYSFTPRV